MGKISITWTKSTIGFTQDQRATVAALGLHKLNDTVVHDDVPTIRGMVNKIRHLVKVSELPAAK